MAPYNGAGGKEGGKAVLSLPGRKWNFARKFSEVILTESSLFGGVALKKCWIISALQFKFDGGD